jgi:hypothetical protein
MGHVQSGSTPFDGRQDGVADSRHGARRHESPEQGRQVHDVRRCHVRRQQVHDVRGRARPAGRGPPGPAGQRERRGEAERQVHELQPQRDRRGGLARSTRPDRPAGARAASGDPARGHRHSARSPGRRRHHPRPAELGRPEPGGAGPHVALRRGEGRLRLRRHALRRRRPGGRRAGHRARETGVWPGSAPVAQQAPPQTAEQVAAAVPGVQVGVENIATEPQADDIPWGDPEPAAA